MAFLVRHYSDIDVTPSRLDLGLFTKEDQAAPQAVAARAPGMPADPAGRSASRDRSAVARAAVSPGGGVTLRLCGGHAAFLTAGRAPAPRSAANVTKGWLVTPQDLSPRKPDAVSRTRGPVRRLLAALPGSRRCRGKRGPHQRRAPAAEARSGRARPSDPRPDGRASDMLSQALREAPWSSPAAPAAPARLAHAGPEHAASHGATRGASAPASVPSDTGGKGGPAHAARCRAALGWDRRVPVGVCGEF